MLLPFTLSFLLFPRAVSALLLVLCSFCLPHATSLAEIKASHVACWLCLASGFLNKANSHQSKGAERYRVTLLL